MQPLVIHPRRRSDDPSAIVEDLYRFADALKAASDALAEIPYGKRPEFDVLADLPTHLGELGDVAKAVNAIADAWQSEIDAEEAAADYHEAMEYRAEQRREAF